MVRNGRVALSATPTGCLLQVIEGLEETRSQLLLVTEPIFASAADLLAKFGTLPPAAAAAREGTRLSELEIKAGLLQVHFSLPEHASSPGCAIMRATWHARPYLTYISQAAPGSCMLLKIARSGHARHSGMLSHAVCTVGVAQSAFPWIGAGYLCCMDEATPGTQLLRAWPGRWRTGCTSCTARLIKCTARSARMQS